MNVVEANSEEYQGRKPSPLIGRRGVFWDIEGPNPEAIVLWKIRRSLGHRLPFIYCVYYTVKKEDPPPVEKDGQDEDEDKDEIAAKTFVDLGSLVRSICCESNPALKYRLLLFDLLHFIRNVPPPATIVFVSGNSKFGPFLANLMDKGYNVVMIASTNEASLAFRDVGLTLYEWDVVINGEGFFPLEDVCPSRKKSYAEADMKRFFV